jgi:hypothetical protein
MQVEPKLDEPFLQFSLKTACISIMLESQHDIIRISHYNQIARCGSLSPLLSNILLTDLDRELERRGHRFCRYADDCNIYVRSRRAGDRVLASMTRYLETRLKLRVNQEKSAVDRPWKRTFLGYTVCQRKYNVRLRVANKSVQRLKVKLKMLFRSGKGRSIRTTIALLAPILWGWVNYFRDARGTPLYSVCGMLAGLTVENRLYVSGSPVLKLADNSCPSNA